MAWDIGAIEYGASQTPVIGPTTPPSTTPPPSFPPTGPGGADDIAEISVRQGGQAVFILGRIFLDSGTEYHSKRQIIHPSHVYQARVKQWGYVDRSIPVPTGLPQLGDCRIQLIDTDQYFRETIAHQTPRRRLLDLRLAVEGASESFYEPFATFEIVDMEFPPGLVEVTGRDINFAWLDKEIVSPINRVNYPTLMAGVDEVFPPIIFGIIDAPGDASPPTLETQGVITLPRMTLSRWALSQAPILNFDLAKRNVGDTEFSAVSSGDYTITESAVTFNGLDYTLEFIDFFSPQPMGMELRITRANGIWFRGAFGSMPAVSNSPILPLRNPVDCLINMLYAILKAETRVPKFNIDSFASVRAQFESLNISASPVAPYFCDGAIVSPMTAREFISQWMTSFECDFYANRYGEMELNLTTGEDHDRPTFSDGPIFSGSPLESSLIGINSVRQRIANPTCNRLRYNFCLNYSSGEFGQKQVYDNTDDQAALGAADSPPTERIEEDIVEFKFVRDTQTALDVARRRMEFLALGSYRIEFDLPLPEVFNDNELAKQIGVTHYGGLELGGYHNEEFKTTGLTYDLDRMRLTVRGIRRTPQTVDQTAGCPGITGTVVLAFGDFETFANNSPDNNDRLTACRVLFDPSDYAGGITSVRFRAKFVKWDYPYSAGPSFKIVDENGTVYLDSSASNPALTYTANPDDTFYLEADVDVVFPYDAANPHTYYIRQTNDATVPTDDNEWQSFGAALWVFLTAADEAMFDFVMLPMLSFNSACVALNLISSATYAVIAGTWPARSYLKDGSLSDIQYREGWVIADAFTVAGNAALFKVSNGVMVPGTEITIATGSGSGNGTRYSVQFQDSITGFEANERYEWRFKRTAGAGSVAILGAGLRTKVGAADGSLCAVSGESAATTFVIDCELVYLSRSFRYDAADWPAIVDFYFEATWNNAETVNLVDTGTIASPIDPPTVVTSLTFPSGATFTTMRSSEIRSLLIDGHIYTVTVSPSTVPVVDVTAQIVMQWVGNP